MEMCVVWALNSLSISSFTLASPLGGVPLPDDALATPGKVPPRPWTGEGSLGKDGGKGFFPQEAGAPCWSAPWKGCRWGVSGVSEPGALQRTEA